MGKIDWIAKLSSRKFWVSLGGAIAAILTALNVDSLTVEQVTVIMGAIGSLVAYVLAEGYVDGKRAAAPKDEGTK